MSKSKQFVCTATSSLICNNPAFFTFAARVARKEIHLDNVIVRTSHPKYGRQSLSFPFSATVWGEDFPFSNVFGLCPCSYPLINTFPSDGKDFNRAIDLERNSKESHSQDLSQSIILPPSDETNISDDRCVILWRTWKRVGPNETHWISTLNHPILGTLFHTRNQGPNVILLGGGGLPGI